MGGFGGPLGLGRFVFGGPKKELDGSVFFFFLSSLIDLAV